MTGGRPFVGTAGWSLPRAYADAFPGEGSLLERYARVFPAAEINSSFYRPHQPKTYARWAASVLEGFRFAVKVPKEATHTRKLAGAGPVLDRFLGEATALGDALGPLLVQLPPSLALDRRVAGTFFRVLRKRFDGAVACEPRHATWFTPAADALLRDHRVARVAADPVRAPGADTPAGDPSLVYYRLHGSPRIYYSPYPDDYLRAVAGALRAAVARGADAWCIFDNTTLGHATGDALKVVGLLREGR
ncbi:MAG TPA: DUF72 domain-containing protein [Gemmatimonadaceae bacterium]|nr:DUF72 domain-containing protein [Gemmatimonadaceae bacterium]